MCGIAGIITREPREQGVWLEAACEGMASRGPDGQGLVWWRDGASWKTGHEGREASRVALGHRRLAILDLSPRGHQPMLDPSGRFALTYNGEIYNYVELRRELEQQGEIFRSETDTEVLLRLLMREGAAGLSRCRGMFAFCWVDLQAQTFCLGRDCFGIKPLFYVRWSGGLAFASVQRPLLALPEVSRKIAPQEVYQYLRFGISDDGRTTLFQALRQVPPAHVLEGKLEAPEEAKLRQYWQPDLTQQSRLSMPEAAAELRERFLQNVRLHLRSDVPVGAALSGGIDSSAIVAGMRAVEPEMEIHTLTYVAEGEKYNEERWAALVAESVGARRHFVYLSAEEIPQDLDAMLEVQENPFGDFSMYAQNRIFRKAREQGIAVLLDGQGGDEMLAGYPQYFGVRVAGAMRRGDWKLLAHWWKHRREVGGGHLAGWMMAGEHVLPGWLKNLSRRAVGKAVFPAFLNPAWFKQAGVSEGRLEAPLGEHGLSGYLWDTIHRAGLPSLLHYEDRNSMAYSVESRVPFLTSDLVEFTLSLPEEYLIGQDGMTKKVFREAMRGLVPDEILARKDKIGFHTPRAEFLRAAPQWVEEILHSIPAGARDLFQVPALKATWKELQKGAPMKGYDFWRVLCFLRWAQVRAVEF